MTDVSAVAPDWQPHLQHLHRQFHQFAADQCLLWVNPAQGDPFEGNPLVAERRVRVPIVHLRFDVQFAPYLVPLDLSKSADAELFEASVRIAWEAWTWDSLQAFGGQPIAGWVIANGTPKALAQHWANNCHLHVFNRLGKLLRFHDPGVREWLWPTLSAIQQRQLLGPTQSLIAFDRQQNLMQQDQMGIEPSGPDESASQRLTLSADQWEQVENYATVHAGWLAEYAEQPGRAATLAKRWEQGVFAALRLASLHGIGDQDDRALFARHALQLGSDFHGNDRLQAVWQRTRAGDFYGGALEEVSGHAADQLHMYLQKNQ
jgi:hypothetical protein